MVSRLLASSRAFEALNRLYEVTTVIPSKLDEFLQHLSGSLCSSSVHRGILNLKSVLVLLNLK
eukprot:230881-Amorphochlora_amoeboformis.AAC.1